MSTTIDQAFIKQFEREVHDAYQRQGSKLRNTVRTINKVKGSSAVFQKVGKGTASTKSTHVPFITGWQSGCRRLGSVATSGFC
jgi:hypothetical protein